MSSPGHKKMHTGGKFIVPSDLRDTKEVEKDGLQH